jgi:hypothetical protein
VFIQCKMGVDIVTYRARIGGFVSGEQRGVWCVKKEAGQRASQSLVYRTSGSGTSGNRRRGG